MIYSKEKHDGLIQELLELAQNPEQVQFLVSLEYEVAARQIKEAIDTAVKDKHEKKGMSDALAIVIRELVDGRSSYRSNY
jgi:predicted GNAT family acetyltransferase